MLSEQDIQEYCDKWYNEYKRIPKKVVFVNSIEQLKAIKFIIESENIYVILSGAISSFFRNECLDFPIRVSFRSRQFGVMLCGPYNSLPSDTMVVAFKVFAKKILELKSELKNAKAI